jgi:F-type H+-transporting ATPase subunit epsilon
MVGGIEEAVDLAERLQKAGRRAVARLAVQVGSSERDVHTGEWDMVVARGREGDVGILPSHAPMLVELAIAPVRLFEGGRERQRILVDGGFLHVTPGQGDEPTRVDVLAEHAALPEEIDALAAQTRADELRRRVEGQGDVEAQADLAKALMRAEYGRR